RVAGRLDDEDVLPPHRVGDAHVDLAVGEAPDLHAAEGDADLPGDALAEIGVGGSGEQPEITVGAGHRPHAPRSAVCSRRARRRPAPPGRARWSARVTASAPGATPEVITEPAAT